MGNLPVVVRVVTTGSVRIEVQDAIFFRAEPANTGLVEDERR